MNKTKVVAMGLSVVALLTMVTGCPIGGSKWHEEAKAAVPEKFSEGNRGKFWINGETYEFPCQLSDFTEKGWEINSSKAPDKIEPHEQTENAYYFKKGEDQILLGLTNATQEEIKLEDSTVDYIEMSVSTGKCVVAGDIELFYQKYEKNEEFLDFTGFKDDFEEMEPEKGDGVEYVAKFMDQKDEYECSVGFVVEDSEDAIRVTKITYSWGYTFETGFVDEIDTLIKSVVNDDQKSLSANYSDYYSKEFVTNERAYLPSLFLNDACDFQIEPQDLSEETRTALEGYVQLLLEKAEYSLDFADGTDDVVMTFTAPDVVSQVNAAFLACDETYEGTVDESYADPAYIDAFVAALCVQADSIEMLEESTVTVSYSDEYYFDIPFIAMLGLADVFGL